VSYTRARFCRLRIPGRDVHTAQAGRGVALMRALVDNVAFRSEPQLGAVVHMVKSLAYDPAHPLWRHTPD
jgi:hypothetical protein